MKRLFAAFVLSASPAVFASDAVDNAYLLCKIIDNTNLATECSVKGWGSTVDTTIDMTGGDARELCPKMAGLMASKGKSLGDPWKLRIFSPYSGDHPIATCKI